jgi:hypothetical protein
MMVVRRPVHARFRRIGPGGGQLDLEFLNFQDLTLKNHTGVP